MRSKLPTLSIPRFLDSLGTPSDANQWLVDHNLAPADAIALIEGWTHYVVRCQ